MTIDNKLQQADYLMDQGRFEESIKIFREAILQEPRSGALGNLAIAHSMWHLQFLERLAKLYPEDATVHAFRILARLKDGRSKNAFDLCTKTLESDKLWPGMIIWLKSLRFHAALESGRGDYLKTDFIAVWKDLPIPEGRKRLLQELLSTKETDLAIVFLALAEEVIFPPSVTELFQKKAQLLFLLSSISDTDFIEK